MERGKLMLFGGGPRPQEALDKFIHWAKADGAEARILIICWASQEPESAAQSLLRDFEQPGISTKVSLRGPRHPLERVELLMQLKGATGIFFSGGDQKRIIEVLGDVQIREQLHWAYENGIPFAGTSAGTAIMSLQMIVGEGNSEVIDSKEVALAQGLGLLTDVIVDQHFLKRKRQNRLFSAVMQKPHLLGVGVDEGAALEILSGRRARVLGDEKVMIVQHSQKRSEEHSMTVDILEKGEWFDFIDKARLEPLPLPA